MTVPYHASPYAGMNSPTEHVTRAEVEPERAGRRSRLDLGIGPVRPLDRACGRFVPQRRLEILQDLPEQEERRRPQTDEDREPLGTRLLLLLVDACGTNPERHRGADRRESEAVQQIATEPRALQRERNSHTRPLFLFLP